MKKGNWIFKVLLVTLILPCMLLFTACWENADTSVTSSVDTSNNDAEEHRTTPLTDAELAYGGFTRDDWSSLTNNELSGLSIKEVDAESDDDFSGFGVYYSGATQEKFNGLASRLFNDFSVNLDITKSVRTFESLKSVINGINGFAGIRQVAGKYYMATIYYYTVDMVVSEEQKNAGDLALVVVDLTDAMSGESSNSDLVTTTLS